MCRFQSSKLLLRNLFAMMLALSLLVRVECFHTASLSSTERRWPGGKVRWCLVKEWPQSQEVPPEHLTNDLLDWGKVHKDVWEMIDDAMRAWNPDKRANVWHEDCGICLNEDGHVLHVRAGERFEAFTGYYHDPEKYLSLSFEPLSSTHPSYGLKKRCWRHEWGHVLGFYHEHQRADLWDDGWFELFIQYFPDFGRFFTADERQCVGRLIPEPVLQCLRQQASHLKADFKTGDRYEFIFMEQSYSYAKCAGASWYAFLRHTYIGAETGDGHGGSGPDWDAIMLYGSMEATLPPGSSPLDDLSQCGWWLSPAKTSNGQLAEVPSNFLPSTGERNRLLAMYGQA